MIIGDYCFNNLKCLYDGICRINNKIWGFCDCFFNYEGSFCEIGKIKKSIINCIIFF